MAATGEVLATNMQELVRPLGIELPGELSNYNRRSPKTIYLAFGTEVDRLLGTPEEATQGKIEADGVTLTVGSRHGLKKHHDDSDPYEGEWPQEEYTSGPRRWLELRAPLHVSGVGVDEAISTGIRLMSSEDYSGLVDERPDKVDANDMEMRICTLWTPAPLSPAEAAFQLNPSTAFAPDLVIPPGRGGGTSEWRLHTETEQSQARYRPGANHNRAFGVGIEVLKHIEPAMLEVSPLKA